MKKSNSPKLIKQILLIILFFLIPLIEFSLMIIFTHDYSVFIEQVFLNYQKLGFIVYIITYFLLTFLLCCFSVVFCDKVILRKKEKKLRLLLKFIMCICWLIGITTIFCVVSNFELMIINPEYQTFLSDVAMQIVMFFMSTFNLVALIGLINLVCLLFNVIKDTINNRKLKL